MAKICVIGARKIQVRRKCFFEERKHEVFLIDANTEIKNASHRC